MAKSSGNTRGSSSGNPRGLQGSINNARLSGNFSMAEMDEMIERFGGSFAHPTTQQQARAYQEATGQTLPQDAVHIIFGRGAADGSAYSKVLERPEYSNMKSIDVTLNDGYGREYATFLTGYKDNEQLRAFVRDVEEAMRVRSHNQAMRAIWGI